MPGTLLPRKPQVRFLSSEAWRTPSVRSFCSFLNCLFILGSQGVSSNGDSSTKLTTVSKAWFTNVPYFLGTSGRPLPTRGMAVPCLPTSQRHYPASQLELEGHPDLSLSGCSSKKRKNSHELKLSFTLIGLFWP